jgi:hypothetical protein
MVCFPCSPFREGTVLNAIVRFILLHRPYVQPHPRYATMVHPPYMCLASNLSRLIPCRSQLRIVLSRHINTRLIVDQASFSNLFEGELEDSQILMADGNMSYDIEVPPVYRRPYQIDFTQPSAFYGLERARP